jgi:DNA-binding response OmpR family regulator
MTQKQVPYLTDPAGNKHILQEDVTTIGRAVANDIVITSKRVSREHAQVRRDGWRMMLEDLGSTNGTFLNEQRVLKPITLQHQDRVKVGDVVLIFHDPDVTYRDTPLPELDVDVAAGVVRVNREIVSLSPKEFTLLAYLFEHSGDVCSKDEIGRAVWPEYEGDVYDYQIENLIRRLRAKIEEDPGAPKVLLTLRGLGYKLLVQR